MEGISYPSVGFVSSFVEDSEEGYGISFRCSVIGKENEVEVG